MTKVLPSARAGTTPQDVPAAPERSFDSGPDLSVPQEITGLLAGLHSFARVDRESKRISLPGAPDGDPGVRADQAAYLYIRAADKRHIEGEDLTALSRTQQAVEETRAAFPLGRGNVIGDPPSARERVAALRKVTSPLAVEHAVSQGRLDPANYLGGKAGAAVFMESGNCGEHAWVATAKLAGFVHPGETVQVVNSRTSDHAWAQLRRAPSAQIPKPEIVVGDAWGEGPAMFASDGKYSDKKWKVKVKGEFDATAASAVGPAVQRTVSYLNQTTSTAKEVQVFSELHMTAPQLILRPRPVLNQRGARGILNALDKPKKTGLERAPDGTVEAARPRSLLSKILRPGQPELIDNKVELRKEILATGVARALGVDTATATQIAPDIIAAADRLSGRKSKKR